MNGIRTRASKDELALQFARSAVHFVEESGLKLSLSDWGKLKARFQVAFLDFDRALHPFPEDDLSAAEFVAAAYEKINSGNLIT